MRDAYNTFLWKLRNALRREYIRSVVAVATARTIAKAVGGVLVLDSSLSAVVHRKDGRREDLGVVSRRVVTTAFANLLVDDLQASQAAFHSMKYHGHGTSGTGELSGDTTLGAEVDTRGTGTQTEGATANVYRSVGSVAAGATRAIVEHGLFSAAAAGTLLDRSVFTVINLTSGDSITFTYDLTVTAGG